MNEKQYLGKLDFIRSAEKLKNVLRSGNTSNGRRESTAEHTWRLCLMAMVFENEFTGIDFLKFLKICIIHDLGEAINGDIPAVEQTPNINKSERERTDFLTLLEPLPDNQKDYFLSLWDEYENASTQEAILAKGLDKLETIIQHNQGINSKDFDYEFNLTYGKKYTENNSVFAAVRKILDEETKQKSLKK